MSTGTTLGVNAAGFLRGGLGLGQAARLYVQALHAAGVPVRTTTLDLELPDVIGADGTRAQVKTTDFADLHVDGELPFNLICVNAPELPGFHRELGEAFFEDKYTIGVWAWEVDVVPTSWDASFALVDEIWVYAHYVQEIFERVSPVPVLRMPLPIVAPPAGGDVRDLELPDGFKFLFLFDFFSTLARKNPDGLIEAFKRAFAPGEGPQLILKSHNGDYKPERLAHVLEVIGDRPDIKVVDRFLTEPDMAALMRACDCYVSLHRAEGFGLTLGEAMALGKPVVATGWSANLDFMTEENSYLVRHGMTEVGPEGENYPAHGTWAEPDLDHAAQQMRHVWEHQGEAREKGRRAQQDLAQRFSVEAVGELARDRLLRLTSVQRRTGRFAGVGDVVPDLLPPGTYVESAQIMQTWDPVRNAMQTGGVKGAARRAALQAMRPYTAHQDQLNRVVAGALRELDDRLEELVVETQRRHMQVQNVSLAVNDIRLVLEGLHARPASGHPAISQTDELGRQVLRFDDNDAGAGTYKDFEDIFRGDEREVRKRQQAYADAFAGCAAVIDLGCGRGEFLELLGEAQIAATGVDRFESMVARCREKGLDVVQADASEHLESLEDGSLPGAFCAQVVEHLPSAEVHRLLGALQRKLVPGGLAIIETVNPHNPAAMKAFWTDPTHHHPLFPEVLLALCRLAGFASGEVRFPAETGVFDDDVHTNRDYAVHLRTRQ